MMHEHAIRLERERILADLHENRQGTHEAMSFQSLEQELGVMPSALQRKALRICR